MKISQNMLAWPSIFAQFVEDGKRHSKAEHLLLIG
jgi:hypothetical protein